MTADHRRSSHDEGLTLVEMLVAVLLTGVIITVLFASFQVFYTNANNTSGRDDHSAAAEVVAAWLDRDLASGTTETIAAGATCAGASTKTVTIKWSDYAHGSSQPADNPPVADPTPYVVTYAVQADTTNANRCAIRRTYTPPSGPATSLVLAQNLTAVDFTPSSPDSSCGDGAGPALTVTIKQYGADAASGSYIYQGCLKGRTNGLI